MLVARRHGALLEGLWEPPGVELADGAGAGPALAKELARLGVQATLAASGERVRHVITRRTIEVEVWRGSGSGLPRAAGLRSVSVARPGLPLTALARRLAGLTRTL